MKWGGKVNVRKLLITGKLVIILLIGFLVYKNLVTSENTGEILSPSSALGEEDPNIFEPPMEFSNTTSDYSTIAQNNIFTRATDSIKDNLADTGDGYSQISDANLDLALIGTVCVDQNLSRAVIKNRENQKIDPYKIGDIVSGARILNIEDDKVFLLYQGKKKSLSLSSNGSTPIQAVSKQNETSKEEKPVQPENNAPIETTAGKLVVLLKKANIEEYSVDKETTGLKVTGLENIPFARRIGLKNGDVVTAINGQRLTGKLKAYQVFKKAKSQPKLTVELLRNDTPKKLVFDLD